MAAVNEEARTMVCAHWVKRMEEKQEAKSDSPQADEAAKRATKRAHRSQKVGVVFSDKMQKTVVVRVDRLVLHTKYRRYVRRTSKFMAHDELGATDWRQGAHRGDATDVRKKALACD